MDKITEKGYLFSHTYSLDNKEIKVLIDKEISKLDLKGKDKNYKLLINVVKNKHDVKLGYSYLWIDNIKIFNALIGLNYDGSERIIKTKEIINYDLNLDLTKDDWSKLAEEEEIKITIEKLEPLISFPSITLTDEEKYKYRNFQDDTEFIIKAASVNQNYMLKNSIYSKRIPSWINEKKIKNYFKIFEKDDRLHIKKHEKFTYPLVKIKNSTVNIIFSNLNPNTATFVYNMARKVYFKDDNSDNEALLIFNQNIKRE